MPSRYWRSTVAIHHKGFDNPEQEATILRELGALSDLFPSWVREVWVTVSSDEDREVVARVASDVPYRRVAINVTPSYFCFDEAQRKTLLTHEVIHAILAAIVDWVDDRLIEPIKESDEKVYAIMEKEWRDRIEGVTQEWTYILERMMARGDGNE